MGLLRMPLKRVDDAATAEATDAAEAADAADTADAAATDADA